MAERRDLREKRFNEIKKRRETAIAEEKEETERMAKERDIHAETTLKIMRERQAQVS